MSRVSVVKTGRAATGEDLYAVLEEDETGSFLVWYNLDRSRYTGPINSITFNTESGAEISNSVSVVYAQMSAVLNSWLYLLYVVTLDSSGNILQVRYLLENGQPFDPSGTPISDRPLADQVSEVYSYKSEIEPIETDLELKIAGREVLEITVNVFTPETRKYGQAFATLLLGQTPQIVPPGHKRYNDRRFENHRIRTIPIVTMSKGASTEADLRYSLPALVIKTPAVVSMMAV